MNTTKMNTAKVEKHLAKLIRFRSEVISIREMLVRLKAEGAVLEEHQEWKVKDMSRMTSFRASWDEQLAHEKRQRQAGKATTYRAVLPDGIFYDIKKTEADFFRTL